MNGIVKYRGVSFKDVLGPITVVHVKVDNANPLNVPLLLNVAGGYGHIVKVAKSHGLADFSMMPGRSNGAKGIVQFALHNQARGLKHSPHSQ